MFVQVSKSAEAQRQMYGITTTLIGEKHLLSYSGLQSRHKLWPHRQLQNGPTKGGEVSTALPSNPLSLASTGLNQAGRAHKLEQQSG